jgi:hypothetical protein
MPGLSGRARWLTRIRFIRSLVYPVEESLILLDLFIYGIARFFEQSKGAQIWV